MTTRITKAMVERMQVGDQQWDGDVKGFGVRCQGKSATFMLKTRIEGRQRWISIGPGSHRNKCVGRNG